MTALLFLMLQADPAALVERLGADDFAAREKADQELRALGPRSLTALRAAAGSGDPEVAARANRLIDDIQKQARERRAAFTIRVRTPEFEMTADPAGVRLTETATGATFEAESMEAFKAAYPEVAARRLRDFTIEFAPAPDRGDDLPPEFGEFFKRRHDHEEFGGRRGKVGANIGPVSETIRAQLGLAEDEGVMVERVDEGSPAARAGLQAHDVILAVDGEPVGNTWALRARIAERARDGRAFEVTVLRKAKRETLTMSFAPPDEP